MQSTRFWDLEFEFDSAKFQANRQKHGIDFDDAQALWRDPRRLELSAQTVGECRLALVAELEGKVWFAVYTMRGEKLRIISVRRARKREVEHYEKA